MKDRNSTPGLFVLTLIMLALLASSCAIPFAATADASEPVSLDRKLINSLKAKDINAARAALEAGADPEAVLGPDLNDHAMCTAIDDRSSKYLELLVEYGASPNAYWDVGYSNHRTPLACSIYLWNSDAFDYLLANGADPSVDLNSDALEERWRHRTALNTALSAIAYPMALKLVQLYELHPLELDSLKYDLEKHSFSQAHPWNKARDELIEWTRERIPDLNPAPTHPVPEGFVPKCLFTFRDHEEGLKEGTLCPETEKR